MEKDNANGNQAQEKSSPLTAYFWIRDEFLPQTECTSAQANILLALAGYADPDGSNVRPGRLNLTRATKYDRDTVREAINFWLRHSSAVLVRISQGNGKTHASVYRILLPDTVPKGADADFKGADQTPLSNAKGAEQTPLQTPKGRERGGKGADSPPIPSTEHLNSKSSSHTTASSSDGSASGDDELRFQKAKANFLAKTPGHKGELAEALELIRDRSTTNGNQPVRNWQAYFKECLANFLDPDWTIVRGRIERAAKQRQETSPEAKEKARLFVNTAREHNWDDAELRWLLREDFHVEFTIAGIAQLSDWDYATATTRVSQPPETACRECGGRGCEHILAERRRVWEEFQKKLAANG